MSVLAFDAHKAVKEAGADERLAEAVVATVGNAMGENLATKADLTTVQSNLTTEIAAVRSDIAALEARLYHHLFMAAGIVGLTVALVKLLS